jgi:hypothetical protein
MHHRLAPLLAAVAALGYAVEGAIVVRAPQPDAGWHVSGYVVEAAFVVALLASLPLVGSLAPSRVGARLAQAGFAALFVSAVVSLAAGETRLGPLFLVGVLASLVGLTVLSVQAVRRRDRGWWAAPAVAVGLVLSMLLGDHGGGILFGIAWAATALADTAVAAPSADPHAA